jgi:hypothetical protein
LSSDLVPSNVARVKAESGEAASVGSINRQTRGSVGQKRVDIGRGYGLAIVVSLWLYN